jgi:hypothetical protein
VESPSECGQGSGLWWKLVQLVWALVYLVLGTGFCRGAEFPGLGHWSGAGAATEQKYVFAERK